MADESLWGNLESLPIIETPGTILKKQASILTDITKSVLRGYVKIDSGEGGEMYIQLYILAPSLGEYRYSILSVSHKVNMYPATVTDNVKGKQYKCDDQDTLLNVLKMILSSKELRNIIASLISQSKA